MFTKYLKKKVALEPDGFIKDIQNPFELEYYLVENDELCNEISSIKTYGIEVVKRDVSSQVVQELECEYIYKVSDCREKAANILEVLARNTVTPVALCAVIDDMLALNS